MPPFKGTAVNVTVPFTQVLAPVLELMLTEGVVNGFTVIVTPVLVAVTGDAQAALLVSTQVITSPFASAAFV